MGFHNRSNLRSLALIGVALAAISSPASAEATKSFEIPAQPLGVALETFGRQSGAAVMFDQGAVSGRTSTAVRGIYSASDALGRLLSGSGFSIQQPNSNTFVVNPRPQTAADPGEVEAVVVTASRLDVAGFQAPTPTVHITPKDLLVAARPNVAAALNDMPQFRATESPQTSSSGTGAGAAPLDLRGLGISRTLVLLDGRRFTSDNDLNTIPTVLIRGVDIVTGGASAAWGSGAVAGVVNISMDRSLQGGKLGAQYGVSSRGDAEEVRLEGAFGTAFGAGRGHIVVGGEYLNNDGLIPRTTRKNVGRWAQVSNGAGGFLNVGDVGFSNAAYGGLIMSGVLAGKAFNPDGSLRNFNYGTVVGASMIGGEGPSNDDFSPLVAPQRRYTLMVGATYDVTDNIKFTADVLRSRMWNKYAWFGDHNRGNLTIKSENAFLPQAVRDAMAAAGQTSFTMGRFNSDLSFPKIDFERVNTQVSLALDGSFADDAWRWSAYYSHGEFENNLDTPGFQLRQEFAWAVDSLISPTSGQPICRIALSNPSTNCVPINLFGLGAPSQEAIDYVTGGPQRRTTTKLNTGGVSLRGEPFALPAGDVSIAVGLEARKEQVNQTVGALDEAKAFTSYSFSAMSGDFTVKEAFGEILIPVVADMPLLKKLDLNGAARISDYDTTGSIWSWKVGATNEFFDGFRGRVTLSRDIRSANLTELFTTTTSGYFYINDPLKGQTVYVLNNGGGNPDLEPERADTLTVGVTWQPPQVSGLNLSIDYFNIKIDDVITTIAPQDLVTRCYNGNTALCDKVDRDSDGNLIRTRSTFVNLAKYETDGIDAELSYRTPVDTLFAGGSGQLQLRLVGTWVNSLTTDDGVSVIEYVRSQGYSFSLGVPKLRVLASVDWKGEVLGGFARARYISSGEYNKTVNIVNNHIDAYTYFDVGVNARLKNITGHNVELYGAVTNLFDKDPPPGSSFSPYYDVIGRYFTIGARVAF